MGIRLGSTVINCADVELMTRFWSQALGLVPSPAEEGDDFRVLRGDRVNLSLQRRRTPVTGRDQMHLDLYSDDQAAKVERLAGLGAQPWHLLGLTRWIEFGAGFGGGAEAPV
jgi:Glyoxalase-like domain